MAVERTIVLRGHNHYEEGTLDTIAKPGMAVRMAADGKYDPVPITQAESLKEGGLWIVREDSLQGKTITDAYAVADNVFLYRPVSGDRLLLLVKSGANIAMMDKLIEEAGGSGLFVEAAGTEARYRAVAKEAAGVLAADTLVKAEWL